MAVGLRLAYDPDFRPCNGGNHSLKPYDFPVSPGRRCARMCAAERGIDLELVTADVREGEPFDEAFRGIGPSCTVPVLELDDDPATQRYPVIPAWPIAPVGGSGSLERLRSARLDLS